MTVRKSPKKTSLEDWHPADVVAALRKRGWSLRQLSAYHGYSPQTLSDTLRRPWPRAEHLIAEAIGVTPDQIWPTRYARRQARGAQHTTRAYPVSGYSRETGSGEGAA